MTGEWLPHTILRVASVLAPADERSQWITEWRSELWYIPRSRSTVFCPGAFRDALWLRRNHPARTSIPLHSPLSCLAFLAVLAVFAAALALSLSHPLQTRTLYWRVTPRDLPARCLMTLALSCLFLPALPALHRFHPNPRATSWPRTLRNGIFLALKIALLQPLLLCGLLVWILTAPVVPVPIPAAWIFALLWAFTDQRRRCPVCLHLLTNPVRIGAPSNTFLEWYGAESICSRGHGLLHVPETPASYSRGPLWLGLDDSWSGLFSNATQARQR